MTISRVSAGDRNDFNRLSPHPLQSWEWGEFRIKTGLETVRLGRYENNKLVETLQMTIHPLPFVSGTIGYVPKSLIPSGEMLRKLEEIGKQYKCIFIKLEPDVRKNSDNRSGTHWAVSNSKLVDSPHPLFTRFSFRLDLTPGEEDLLKKMHPKTRYNIKVARKHGVTISEENTTEAFDDYLNLTFETAKRQRFYAHNRKYHVLMWETMKENNLARLFTAKHTFKGKTRRLAAWIIFLFNNCLYYPYGSSSEKLRNVMASNLLMWEIIRWGKKNGAKFFDMWGALGNDPDPRDPWFGFHRFKQGYGPELIESVGSFDLVISPFYYQLFNIMHRLRSAYLSIKSRF